MSQYQIKNTAFKKSMLSFLEDKLVYNGAEMRYDSIVAFHFSLTDYKTAGIKLVGDFVIDLYSADDGEISIKFIQSGVVKQAYDNLFELLADECWERFGKRILSDALERIESGEEVEMCGITLSKTGVAYEKKPLFSKAKTYRIDWIDLMLEHGHGRIRLSGGEAKPIEILKDLRNIAILIEIVRTKIIEAHRQNEQP